MMRIYTKCCPHCKTGDLHIEDHTDETIGRMYFIKCGQCGWDKDITDQVREMKDVYATSSRT